MSFQELQLRASINTQITSLAVYYSGNSPHLGEFNQQENRGHFI